MKESGRIKGERLRRDLELIMELNDNINIEDIVSMSGGNIVYEDDMVLHSELEILTDDRFIIRINSVFNNNFNNNKVLITEKYVIWYFYTKGVKPGIFKKPVSMNYGPFIREVKAAVNEFLLPEERLRINVNKARTEDNLIDLNLLAEYYGIHKNIIIDRCIDLKIITPELV